MSEPTNTPPVNTPPVNTPPVNTPPVNTPPAAAINFDKMPEVIRTKLTGRGITPDQAGFERLATSYDAADRVLNGAKDVVAVPGDKATPEDWGKLYTALGRPEKPDNYQYSLPAGQTMDPAFKGFANQMLYDMGIPANRAQSVIDAYTKFGQEQAVAQAKAADLQLETYKTSRGAAFDQELARGMEVAKTLGLDHGALSKIESAIAEPGKPGAAAIVELFAKLGARLAEGGFKAGGGSGGGSADPSQMSYEQANAAITAKQSDEAFMKKYNNKVEPGHDEAVKELEALFARRASTKKAA